MRIVAKRSLREFWQRHAAAEGLLRTWYAAVKSARWSGPIDVKSLFGSADFVAGNRAIFNIGGNRFRLVAKINYRRRIVFIRFIGTHNEYDKIDPETV